MPSKDLTKMAYMILDAHPDLQPEFADSMHVTIEDLQRWIRDESMPDWVEEDLQAQLEEFSQDVWNRIADEYNQWPDLGQDEKDKVSGIVYGVLSVLFARKPQ